VEVEAARIAAVIARRDAFIAAKIEATRLSDAESASAHRPVEQSPECKQAERDRYEFMMRMNIIHNIWYLQGKNADESPPPQELPARAAELLDNVLRFYAGHYVPESQGKKSYTDPRTGGPTCTTNEIIYDTIYASLPDDCKLTFAQMFSNFDDLCSFKAPLYVNGEKFDFEKHVLGLFTDAQRAKWWRLTVNHLKRKYIDAIKNGVKKAIVLVFGRLPIKYWPGQHRNALRLARKHILRTKERVVEFTLEIFTCDHFSSLCFGRDDEVIDEMQEALKKSQGGILEGRVVNHLMLKYNRAKIIIREKKAKNTMVIFSRRWTREERVVIKMSLLSTDEIPKSVYSYFRNWSEYIAEDASCRCGYQISVSEITVQHLTVYFASRGGKGNLGKKCSAEHCARISEGKKGKKCSAEHCARISEGKKGKKHSAEHCARISEGKKGKKHSAEHCARISKGNKGKKHSAEHCARISKGNLDKKLSAATCARISEGKKGKKLSAEHCARIGKGNLGKKRSAATCAKISKGNLGKKLSAEHCARISEALQSKKLSAEHCAKIGKTLKEEMQ
jgi:hypothetical protein